jgi:hypothetical protein
MFFVFVSWYLYFVFVFSAGVSWVRGFAAPSGVTSMTGSQHAMENPFVSVWSSKAALMDPNGYLPPILDQGPG